MSTSLLACLSQPEDPRATSGLLPCGRLGPPMLAMFSRLLSPPLLWLQKLQGSPWAADLRPDPISQKSCYAEGTPWLPLCLRPPAWRAGTWVPCPSAGHADWASRQRLHPPATSPPPPWSPSILGPHATLAVLRVHLRISCLLVTSYPGPEPLPCSVGSAPKHVLGLPLRLLRAPAVLCHLLSCLAPHSVAS